MLGGAEALSPALAERLAQRLFLTPLPLRARSPAAAAHGGLVAGRALAVRARQKSASTTAIGEALTVTRQMAVNRRHIVLLMHGWAGRATADEGAGRGACQQRLYANRDGRTGTRWQSG